MRKEKQSDLRTFLDEKFAGMDEKFAGMDAKFAGIDATLAAIDGRLGKIETHLDKQDADLEHRTLSILKTVDGARQDARLWSSKLFALVDEDLKLHREEHGRPKRSLTPAPSAKRK